MLDNMIGQYMVRSPKVAEPGMRVSDALTFLRELRIRHLPVVESRRLVGIVSERDLIGANPSARVSEIMKKKVYVVSSKTAVSDVAAEMANNKIGSAVIVDPHNHVIGIFTTTDALRILAEMDERDPVLNYLLDEEELFNDPTEFDFVDEARQ